MVPDPVLRHHPPPVGHRCVISKRQYSGCCKYGREEGFGPWFGLVAGGPCVGTTASQAVDEDDTRRDRLASVFQLTVLVLCVYTQ